MALASSCGSWLPVAFFHSAFLFFRLFFWHSFQFSRLRHAGPPAKRQETFLSDNGLFSSGSPIYWRGKGWGKEAWEGWAFFLLPPPPPRRPIIEDRVLSLSRRARDRRVFSGTAGLRRDRRRSFLWWNISSRSSRPAAQSTPRPSAQPHVRIARLRGKTARRKRERRWANGVDRARGWAGGPVAAAAILTRFEIQIYFIRDPDYFSDDGEIAHLSPRVLLTGGCGDSRLAQGNA